MVKKSTQPINNSLLVAGVDEAGRGPWAGPLVACAYIEVKSVKCKVTDSKKMTALERDIAFDQLRENGYFAIGICESYEIDKLGLAKANNLAFKRAIENLPVKPDLILIDGRDRILKSTTQKIPYKTIIKGDLLIRAISCASIIAKVTRDRLMKDYSLLYPEYQFEKHKGYGTLTHRNAIKKNGITPIHRKSYQPVKKLAQEFSN